ncbi:glycosyltransferase [Flavobacterium sp.]|uniref:glycosyltransferase family 4 protein n=1 Tax=Flavobacterium sp. TaxID=239 RepID=UPI0028BDD142|nr:glycosyltransferase [Flavobacterium sp.]
MKFAVYTHVNHTKFNDQIYGYGPYIREMNIWISNVDTLEIVGPVTNREITPLDIPYKHSCLTFTEIPLFNVTNLKDVFKTFFRLPLLFWVIFKSMKSADHIHLRCPGNVGLIACLVQILFPKTLKTAKYAGNWDLKAKQPLSYRIQKWILNNTFLTRNMKVLVYGEWEGSSKNIKPFFTATYKESDKKNIPVKSLQSNTSSTINFIFVGTLSEGKRPLYAVRIVESLKAKKYSVQLHIYGEGPQRKIIEDYIRENNLEKEIVLCGNQEAEVVLQAYQKSHFLLLPSKSEGWPKVVAEAMFWGAVPVSTVVSCVPYMVGEGTRGLLLTMDLKLDSANLESVINNDELYSQMSQNGLDWSRQFTLDYFEEEVKKMVLKN